MRLCEKPLIPWIFAEDDGKIIFGHCNCMAGLDESCSLMLDSMMVTQKKAHWVVPFRVKEVTCSKIKDMKFQGEKGTERNEMSK